MAGNIVRALRNANSARAEDKGQLPLFEVADVSPPAVDLQEERLPKPPEVDLQEKGPALPSPALAQDEGLLSLERGLEEGEPYPVEIGDLEVAEQPEAEDQEVDLELRARIARSITPHYILCLEDGETVENLRKHLKTAHRMTPSEYLGKWGLPKEYPMMAPNFRRVGHKVVEYIRSDCRRG